MYYRYMKLVGGYDIDQNVKVYYNKMIKLLSKNIINIVLEAS